MNLYSLARVFYDHSLQCFESFEAQNEVDQIGLQGVLCILCQSNAGLAVVKSKISLK